MQQIDWDLKKLKERLKLHEGKKKSAYLDSKGYLTIGIGRCIDKKLDCGLTDEEIFYLLENDLNKSHKELSQFDWYKKLDDVRREVLIELHFNMGLPKLLTFKKMIAALSQKNYPLATQELLNSKWKDDVGVNRSTDIAQRLLNGKY